MSFYNRYFVPKPLLTQRIVNRRLISLRPVSRLTLLSKVKFNIRYNSTYNKNPIALDSKSNHFNSKPSDKPSLFTENQLVQARRERLEGLGPIISHLPEKMIPYAELMRLEKPVGTWLLYILGLY